MIRGIIVEGLSTTGKSSVFSAVKRLHSQSDNGEKSMIAVSEHYSQVLHSHRGVLRSMEREEHIQLLTRHVDYIEQQFNWIYQLGHTKSSNGIFYLLERFHLNHRAAFKSSTELVRIESRLSRLNAHCILLTLSPDAVQFRYMESRGEDWKNLVMKNRTNPEEACQWFLEQQEQLRLCARQSGIPTIEINTDEADWERYAYRILEEIS